jgi:peptidoglycan/LPS O-acetylase OafA/YrhL
MALMSREHSETIPSLNGIRAISVLLVVVSHAGFGNIVPGGLGVTIFFFLSGYLITTLMLAEHDRTGRIDIRNFYLRRCFRLFPPLLVTLAIAYGLVATGILPGGITLRGLLSQLLYFANYYGIFFDPGNTIPAGTGILWSLAVEEHFYIFYPLVMSLLLSRSPRPTTIGIVLVSACVAIVAWRVLLVQSAGFLTNRTYYASDTRIDSIIYGCLLAVSMNPVWDLKSSEKMSLPQRALFVAAICILLLTIVYRDPFFRETFRYSLQGIALLPIFYFSIRYHDNAVFRHLNSNWIIALGIWSYAIYLSHYVIINLIEANAPAISNLSFLLFSAALVISAIYAALIDRVVDSYFRGLRRKYRSKLAPSDRCIREPEMVRNST